MATTYSTLLRLAKQGTGDNNNTWGTVLNTLIDLIDAAIAGMSTINTTGGTTTLTASNNAADQARNAILKITGALVSNVTIEVPASTKKYTVWNATTNAFSVTVKTPAGSGIAVTQGKVMDLFCDGTDVKVAQTELQSPTISGATLTGATITIADNVLTIQDNADATKQVQFQLSGITTGNTRTLTIPDESGTLVTTATLTSYALLGAAQAFTKAQRGAVVALTSSAASIAVDLSLANNYSHTMTENTTLAAPSNIVAGQSGAITITQHASSAKTLAFASFWKFAGGSVPVLSTAVGSVDVLTYYVNAAGYATCSLIKAVA